MDQKDKALKIAATAVAILAVAMIAYYWIAWRARKTENDLNLHERVEAAAGGEEKSDFAGVYSASDPIEGLGHRLGFIAVNRKEDGPGYSGSAKVDAIASAEESSVYFKCSDVNIGEKDFFLKCADPGLGQISFVGEWQKSSAGVQVVGKVMWSKDGTEVLNKATTLNHTL